MIPSLELLQETRFISALDRHFALGISRIAGEPDERVVLAAALASRQVAAGHLCLDFGRPGGFMLQEGLPSGSAWPARDEWLVALRSSDLVERIDAGNQKTRTTLEAAPLVLDAADRLYLRRYWALQRSLAEELRARAVVEFAEVDEEWLREGLDRLFGPVRDPVDPQRRAVAMAMLRRLAVITGGPGTGKTSTVAKLLALGIEEELAAGRPAPRIMLVAPTGKAAARLAESIATGVGRLDADEAIRSAIPTTTATIHRALGIRIGTNARPRHHARNPLPADWLVVDEASMVDLALMCRLVAALPCDARLILLGDEFQLASVEAGAVLGDICNAGDPSVPSNEFSARLDRITGQTRVDAFEAKGDSGSEIRDCIVRLRGSHRYAEGSGIEALTHAVREGGAEAVLEILDDAALPDVRRCDPGPAGGLPPALLEEIAGTFRAPLGEFDLEAQLAGLSSLRLLAVHRRGEGGVETLNRQVVAALRRLGWTQGFEAEAFPGCPILITRNDYDLEVFNGDTGLLCVSSDGALCAAFANADSPPRRISIARLPAHETAFAMTVHKSQGSEFDRVVVVLPESTSAILSRELLYTAVSRARREVVVVAHESAIAAAIERRIERASGLHDLLWN